MTSLHHRNDVSHEEAAVSGEVRRSRAFALLAAGFFMTVVDLTITNVALMNTFSRGAGRNKALGICSGIGATAASAGPLAGGLLTQYAGWRYIFFLNVRPAAGPPGRAGKQAARRPPTLRPAWRCHRDRRPRRPGHRQP